MSQIWNNLIMKNNHDNNRLQNQKRIYESTALFKKKKMRVEKSLFHRRISTLEAILTLENHCFAITNVIIDLEKIRTRC